MRLSYHKWYIINGRSSEAIHILLPVLRCFLTFGIFNFPGPNNSWQCTLTNDLPFLRQIEVHRLANGTTAPGSRRRPSYPKILIQTNWRLLSPSQLFKFLDYSLNSRNIALPQVVVFFYHRFGTGYEFSCIYYVLWVVQYAEQCFQIV